MFHMSSWFQKESKYLPFLFPDFSSLVSLNIIRYLLHKPPWLSHKANQETF